MRIIFMGTPTFAVPVLKALHKEHTVVAVVSQPDREKDKKGRLLPTAVKACALALGIPCLQVEKVGEHVDELKAYAPDVLITAAFGQLLPQTILDIASRGVLNVHASLLPLYRGSSPITAAILAGDAQTGVTVMQTALGMDSGDILSMASCAIEKTDTTATLTEKLSLLGANLLCETLEKLEKGEITPTPQDAEKATYCKKIVKSDGLLDFSLPASVLARKVCAYDPWPIAYATYNGVPLKIYEAEAVDCEKACAFGTLLVERDALSVRCGEGALKLLTVQLPGKKAMGAAEFLRGHRMTEGEKLNG
ncbi:MAG: methionyl-tRNA formyltransferase [Clostridiales bacterium]|nr:methionyl-tRNA formyltransferase [Clostridiales bacterium]